MTAEKEEQQQHFVEENIVRQVDQGVGEENICMPVFFALFFAFVIDKMRCTEKEAEEKLLLLRRPRLRRRLVDVSISLKKTN